MRWITLHLLLAILSLVAPLSSQQRTDPVIAGRAQEAIGQLLSPYCPGMLEACTSPMGGALRDSIYDLAAQGVPPDEIVEWMLANHGEQFRAVPQGTGAGLWAWVIPPIAILTAVGLLVVWLRANRSGAAPQVASPAASAISDTDRDQLSRALRDWQDAGEEDV